MQAKKRWVMVLIAAVALFAAACAEEEPEAPPVEDVEDVDFQACLVTDEGGVEDRSFNETAWAGVEQAEAELGVETALLESRGPDDYEPNINAFIAQDCDIIVTVGFLLGDNTAAAAEANPEQLFAIVDFNFFDEETGEDVTYDNVRELTFGTDEAAFLSGYLAAGMTETGSLGTFGGIPIPTVTIFMNGFEAGMNHYNEQHGTDVELLGWDAAADDGLFTGDFTNQDNGRRVTETLLEEGADIILPVAGPVGLGAAAAVEDAGDAALIWVDTDGCISAEEFCSLFLTSVMKNMDVAVFDSIQAALEDRFEGGLYVGTLENDGVGIAPFHEFDAEVPDDLKTDIEEVRQGIIEGSISVEP